MQLFLRLALTVAFLWVPLASAQIANSPPGPTGATGSTGSTGPTGAAGTGNLLGSLKSANFNTTADQAISMLFGAYKVSQIDISNCTGTFTLAAGGFYTAASKGGTVIVLAAQAYSGLTSGTVVLQPTIVTALLTTRLTGANIYFSLTTGAGGTATCDIFVFGDAYP
jgi:hypothetical protein